MCEGGQAECVIYIYEIVKEEFNGNFLKRNKIENFLIFCASKLYESGKCNSCLILAHSTLLSMKIKIVT